MKELAKNFQPSESEPAITARWDAAKVFAAPAEPSGETYSVVIPPPNVTAALHLGHAFNTSLQDVMVRYNRMLGKSTMWMPGTDHAGIATQTVVEKRLLSQGTKRLEMGREAFVEKTQEWKDEYEQVILDQFRAMGASCDWDRTRFTMDDMCSTAVRHAFFTLFKDGLIYRGKRLVNWDPATQTALADDEVESEDVDGHMWYLDYPLTDGSGTVTVATTRPETMLGDSAVAMNPTDPRAKELVGKTVTLPIVGRVIPIIEDDYVVLADPESSDPKAKMASGFLKVTPAHDPNDWDIGLRHELPVINVMAADASISDKHGWEDVCDEAQQFVGMSREDARTAIVAWFETNGLLKEVKDHPHAVGHSYRSHVPIEPWLSDQWYVKVTDDRLAGSALRAMDPEQQNDIAPEFKAGEANGDGDLKFYPDRYSKTFQGWHENLRDWCISRQLWWGHQIPVWSKTVSLAENIADLGPLPDSQYSKMGAWHVAGEVGADIIHSVCVPSQETLSDEGASSSEDEIVKKLEDDGFVRDPDVLDTWFSSALWPLSTMGWPFPQNYPETVGLLDAYNPTSVLMTAREIITLWVSRMTMFNRYFMDGQVPFKDVFIHAMIQDGNGQKMSKSLGNGVDPRDIIFSHGADAMRYALTSMATDTQDVRMPVDVVCPHTGESFDPEYITTQAGHVVAAPTQKCPTDPSKEMVTLYGVATGQVEATDERPLARNSSPKFDAGRSFVNKVWNATKFMLSRLDEDTQHVDVDIADTNFIDQWIIGRLQATLEQLDAAYGNYQYNKIAELTYDFVWRDLCDVYLEATKPTIDNDPKQQVVLATVFDAVLRILHPMCPFVTEELWPHVQEAQRGTISGLTIPARDMAATARWPQAEPSIAGQNLDKTYDRLDALVSEVRAVRAARQVKPKQKLTVHGSDDLLALVNKTGAALEALAGVESTVSIDGDKPDGAASFVFEAQEVLVSGLVGAGDVEAEKKRLEKSVTDLDGKIANLEKRLSNENYVNKAKPELVQQTRDELVSAQADLETAKAALTGIG